MTPQAIWTSFVRLCPLKNTEGIKYRAKDPNTIHIDIPHRGTFEFEYHNDKKWRFEHL